ncbi:MAG: hypothetical protein IJV30_02040 [Oscillospiraceae bacterium]|nr:hypothetical protein [Oscillospiraceae bacterium]
MENLYRKRTCSRCGTSTFEAVTGMNDEISAYRPLDAFEFEPSGFMDVEVRCEGKTSASFTLCQSCQDRLDQMLEELKRGFI